MAWQVDRPKWTTLPLADFMRSHTAAAADPRPLASLIIPTDAVPPLYPADNIRANGTS